MKRIVDISTSGVKCSLFRGFLRVKKDHEELGRVALDDIYAVIIHAYGASITTNLIAQLSKRGVTLVLCDPSQAPVSMTLPLAGHYSQNLRMREQWEGPLPLRKQLWKRIVCTKIMMQASLLSARGQERTAQKLKLLSKKVKSGDPNNIEGHAARYYWPVLMGAGFKRWRTQPGINSFLNYGYTIIRSMVARSIVASGLHPSIGVGHCHREDTMALADDLMEPFRPLVDAAVIGLNEVDASATELDTEKKRKLASLISFDVTYEEQISPLHIAAAKCAHSLATSFHAKDANKLVFFEAPSPVEWSILWE